MTEPKERASQVGTPWLGPAAPAMGSPNPSEPGEAGRLESVLEPGGGSGRENSRRAVGEDSKAHEATGRSGEDAQAPQAEFGDSLSQKPTGTRGGNEISGTRT